MTGVTPASATPGNDGAFPDRSFELVLGLGERTLSTYVGRDRELELVRERIERVRASRGQIVGVRGEPGVGKSRLLYEIARDVTAAGLTYLAGRCLSYAAAVPYVPILDILRQQCGLSERDSAETAMGKVRAAVAQAGMDADEQAPYLLQFLGVKPGTERVSGLGAEVLKARTLEPLRQLALGASRRRPLAIVVEDLHWIDRSSEEYLALLAEKIAGVPVLLLASYRPEYRPVWADAAHVTEIALPQLSREASLAIVDAVLAGNPLPAARKQAIVERAEGNPLFLEELALAIDEGGESEAVVVPDTIHAVLAGRMDRLGAQEQHLLTSAAVFGKDVPARLLREVAQMLPADFAAALKELEHAGLLFLMRAGDDEAYTFKHALTQESAYGRLPPEERRALHARVVGAVEALDANRLTEHAELLAHHAAMATDDLRGKAVHYLHEAGRKSIRRSAHVEAIAHLTRALELLPSLPDTPERAEREIALLLALGVPLAATRGYSAPEVAQAYGRARELSGRIGDPARSLPAVYGLWRFYLLHAEYQTARELTEQLLALAARADDAALHVQAHRATGATAFYMGDYGATREHCDAVWTHPPTPERHAQMLAHDVVDPWVAARAYKSWALWLVGQPDAARREIEAVTALAREIEHPFSIALALSFASWLHQFCGDVARTRGATEEALALSIEHGFGFWLGWNRVMQAWTLLDGGDSVDAVALLRQGLEDWEATGSRLGRTYFLSLLSEAYQRRGNAQAALDTLAGAKAFALNNHERWWQPELDRLEGELQCAAGRTAEGEACFRQALELARRQGARSLELRAASSLARLWQRQGQRAAARRELAAIVGPFTEGADTDDLRSARGLLAELA
jgi:predicted ATPase